MQLVSASQTISQTKVKVKAESLNNPINSPMTEFTFLDVFFPKAQMQAHSAGTVKLARDHWLSTYCPITGPTFPTLASLGKTTKFITTCVNWKHRPDGTIQTRAIIEISGGPGNNN